MADLVVKISGDISSFSKSLNDAEEKTEALNDKFKLLGIASTAMLASMTGAAYLAIKAFGEHDQAVIRLTQSMQQQGVYSRELLESYKAQAEATEKKTGIDAEAILQGMAMLQGLIGQTKITKELTAAAADLSTRTGDISSAFDLMAKAANGNTVMLKKMGIEMVDHHDRTKNLEEATRKINAVFGGQAESMTRGLGGIRLLRVAYDDMQKAIGERLAPAYAKLLEWTTGFFQLIGENKVVLDMITSIGIAVGVVSALGVALAAGSVAFFKIKAAMAAAEVAAGATGLAFKGLVGATGIGLLIVLASELWLNWGSIWPRMYGVFRAFADNVGGIAGSLGMLLVGALTFDKDKIVEGWNELKNNLKRTMGEYNTVVDLGLKERTKMEEKAAGEQNAKQKEAADKREKELQRNQNLERQIQANKHRTMLEQLEMFNAQYLQLERQETAILEALRDESNKKIWKQLEDQLKTTREMKALAHEDALIQQATFDTQILARNEDFAKLTAAQQQMFLGQNLQAIRDQMLTRKTLDLAQAKESLARQVTENNDFLKNQQKFSTAYALIHQVMHSEIFQGTASAMTNLSGMVNSKNRTLKEIGKAAALANIGIKTAEAAMNVYAGFSTIPIVGQALGIAAAAAVTAYGAEQAADVLALAEGGLVSGGIAGRDSVPAMLMPGEMVVPTRNFDEVINAVALARSQGATPENPAPAGGGLAVIEIRLRDQLMDFIETKLIERQNLGVAIQGGV